MRKDVKQLADAMQSGWNLHPHNSNGFTIQKLSGGRISLCPLAHALVGSGVPIKEVQDAFYSSEYDKRFPVLKAQKVLSIKHFSTDYVTTGEYALADAIIDLADIYHYSTPDVIEWLRSHQND